MVDVRCEIEIERPRGEVADYASNPDNALSWYENIKEVEWNHAKPLEVGSRIVFAACDHGLGTCARITRRRPRACRAVSTSTN